MRDREFKKLSKKQLLKLLIKREETYQAFREGKETDPSLEQLKEALERERSIVPGSEPLFEARFVFCLRWQLRLCFCQNLFFLFSV